MGAGQGGMYPIARAGSYPGPGVVLTCRVWASCINHVAVTQGSTPRPHQGQRTTTCSRPRPAAAYARTIISDDDCIAGYPLHLFLACPAPPLLTPSGRRVERRSRNEDIHRCMESSACCSMISRETGNTRLEYRPTSSKSTSSM